MITAHLTLKERPGEEAKLAAARINAKLAAMGLRPLYVECEKVDRMKEVREQGERAIRTYED